MSVSTLLDHAAVRAMHLRRSFFVLPTAGIARIRSVAPSGAWSGYIVTPAGERLPVNL